MIEAAGGIVWRRTPMGHVEVLVAHRPVYDDWSFPKGKLDPGESHADAARREVEEETGFACVLAEELPEVRYLDRKGRPKRVRYWAMTPVTGSFIPNDEVDDVRWLPVGAAAALLSYPRDVELLGALCIPVRA